MVRRVHDQRNPNATFVDRALGTPLNTIGSYRARLWERANGPVVTQENDKRIVQVDFLEQASLSFRGGTCSGVCGKWCAIQRK